MKHKEITKAWLDGAEVECDWGTGEWTTLRGPDAITYIYSFDDGYEYRIKPKPEVVNFKVYKNPGDNQVRCVDKELYPLYDNTCNWVCISDEQTAELPLKI